MMARMFLLICCLTGVVARAEGTTPAPPPDPLFDEKPAPELGWSGSARVGLDSEHTRQVELGLDFPLERELLASFEAGRSVSTSEDGLVDTSSFGLELTAAPDSDLEGGVRYDYFGNTEEIRTHELTPSVTVRTDDWELTASPGLRLVVTVVDRPLIGDTITRSHLSYSVGGRARYLGWSPVFAGAFGTRYLYSRAIREDRLERSARIGAISQTAFTVVSGILDWNYGLSAGLELDAGSVELSASTSRTFVSKADALAFALAGEVALSDDWALGPEVGRYLPEGSPPSTFGALSVVYSW